MYSTHPRSPLRIASCMAPNADAMCRALAAWLGSQLGMAVEMVDNVPWQERERLLDAGAIDLAWICGLPYVRKADGGDRIELCVVPVMQGARYGDRPVYFSDVVVRSDSRFEAFEDLAGETWAYNEPRSHSGFNLVCYHLGARGWTLEYFGRLVEAGTHQRALRFVASGAASAAAIDSTVLEAEVRAFPEYAGAFRTVDTLGPSPAPPWVMSTRLPAKLREKIRRCLTGMRSDTDGREILGSWGIAELRAVGDADYDPIREMTRTAAGALIPDGSRREAIRSQVVKNGSRPTPG